MEQLELMLFLHKFAPPLRATSCNVHYSGSILYDNERETWSKSSISLNAVTSEQEYNRQTYLVMPECLSKVAFGDIHFVRVS
jgi:hypothetical protein